MELPQSLLKGGGGDHGSDQEPLSTMVSSKAPGNFGYTILREDHQTTDKCKHGYLPTKPLGGWVTKVSKDSRGIQRIFARDQKDLREGKLDPERGEKHDEGTT